MDGYRLCHEIRKHARLRDLPIIIHTATYTSPGDAKLALDMGANKYLMKPVSVEILVATLHEVIAQPHAAPRADALREIVVLKEYNERLVSKLLKKNTELQAQAEALRESERRFQTLADTSPVGIFRTDAQGQTTYVNPRWCQITGLSVTDMLGHGWLRAVHPEDRGKIAQDWQAATQVQGASQADYRLVRPDGTISWVMGQAVPEKDDTGLVAGYVGTITDITERKRAEGALRETNEYLENLFNHANAPIIVWNPQFKITRFNHAFEMLTGRKAGDVVGGSLEILFPPALVASSMELIRKTLGGERWETVEIAILHLDGSVRTVLWNSATVFAANGKTSVAGIAQGQDITERKQTEAALRESEERFRMMVESIKDYAIITLDVGGHVTSWNLGAERSKGWRADEIVGQHFSRFYPPEDVASGKLERELAVATAEGRFEEEGWRVRKDGSRFMANVILTNLRDHAGHLRGFAKITRDITERKRAEEALHKSHENYHRVIEDIFKFVPEALLVFTGNLDLFKDNQAFEDLLRTHAPKLNYTEPELRETLLQEIRAKVLSGDAGEIRIPPKNRDEQGTRGPDHSGEGAEPAAPPIPGVS
jgi:PAS domain S-box-containing protein